MTAAADLTCRVRNVNDPGVKTASGCRLRNIGLLEAAVGDSRTQHAHKKIGPQPEAAGQGPKSRERDSSQVDELLVLLGGPELGLEGIEIEVELLSARRFDFVGRRPADAHVGAERVALEI